MLPVPIDWQAPFVPENPGSVKEYRERFAEEMKKPLQVLPVGTGEIKMETQAFVYFDADKPIEIEPIILTGDEIMLHDAIRALAAGGLLTSADCFKYRDVIERKPPKSVMKRFREWRARNAD